MRKVTIVLHERVLNENEVIVVDSIDHDNYEEYRGKTVKVKGDVDLRRLGLTKIPINFTEVGGTFYCYENKLTTLVGAPEKVGRDFDCSFNRLTSLKGAPEKVGDSFYCWYNQLTDLVGAPEKVGGDFHCPNNPLKSTKGKPEYIGGEFRS